MIDLYLKDRNELLGSITEAELQYLADSMEETSLADRDYFVDQSTIDLLADGRATGHLLNLLRKAVGSGEGTEIRWQQH
jgi:hypothetical protein